MADWRGAIARLYKGKRGETGSEYCGTAFMVSNRHLLTCFHVVRDLQEEDVFLYDVTAWRGGLRRVRSIYSNEHVDVAVLELREPTEHAGLVLVCRDQNITPADKNVECSGFSSEQGDLDCVSVKVSSFRGEYNLYVFPVPVGKGVSGAPVLYQNELVGISRLQDDRKTYLIPLRDFQDLINEHVLHSENELSFPPPLPEPSRSDSLQGLIERNVAKKLRLFPVLFKELREEMGLREDIQPTLIAKKLCNHANPRWPVDKLRQPVCFFLDELQMDSPVKLPKAVEGIKVILGWLLLRGVNEDFLVDQIGQIDPLKGFHLEVGFHEHAPVEVMIAFTGQRCAHYESEPRGHQVRGDRAIDLTRLFDFGYRLEDQAEGIIRAVWQMVYSGDRPKLLGETQQERESYSDQLDRQLNADLRESGGWTKEFYLMAPGYEKSNPLNDIVMSKLLRQRLPSLKMIAFGVKGKGTGLTWAGEELSASVRMFLLELNNYL
ncbi:MAG: serine protease [Candidatus Electrothrix communis]|nr:MAG: serine protease [Candidatus Electrothrix communis]